MIFNCIVLLLILLLTGYMANQGLLSTALLFVAATFGSLLAGALFEPLQQFIGGWRPDYARGLTMLLLFFFAFAACRLTADFAVPKNIKLSKTVDLAGGVVVGLFASLIIIGTVLIGVEMLPLPSSLLGFDRYPTDKRMQATAGDLDIPGSIASSSGIWLGPDSLTLGIWKLALGKALGGNMVFSDVHPDLSIESYGYRNTVEFGVHTALSPELLSVAGAYSVTPTDAPDLFKKVALPDPTGKRLAVVRTEVALGTTEPKTSSSTGGGENYFFVTPTNVRLVTDKGRQYYPIGYLENGATFVSVPLDVGQMAEDYSQNKVVDDWVFQTNDDEKPAFIEVKQLARVRLAGLLKDKPISPLARSEYPPHKLAHETSTVIVSATGGDRVLKGVRIFILETDCQKRDVNSELNAAYSQVVTDLDQISNGSGDWSTNAGKPGVPDTGVLRSALRVGQEIKSKALDDPIFWSDVVPILLAGKAVTDGSRNLTILPEYFNQTIVPLFSSPKAGTSIIKSAETDESGAVTLTDIPKGGYTLVAEAKLDNAFYVWAVNLQVEAKTEVKKEISTSSSTFSIVLPK